MNIIAEQAQHSDEVEVIDGSQMLQDLTAPTLYALLEAGAKEDDEKIAAILKDDFKYRKAYRANKFWYIDRDIKENPIHKWKWIAKLDDCDNMSDEEIYEVCGVILNFLFLDVLQGWEGQAQMLLDGIALSRWGERMAPDYFKEVYDDDFLIMLKEGLQNDYEKIRSGELKVPEIYECVAFY